MEDKKSSLTEAENAAAFSAATLRELQTRAQQALAASREEATRLESDITRQLDELAETISRQLAADSQSLSQSDSLQAELARLADELKNSRAECQSTRSELEGARKDLAATAAKRAEVCKERDELVDRLAKSEAALQSAEAEWRAKFDSSEHEWQEERSSLSAERDELTKTLAARGGLESERDELIARIAEFEGENQAAQAEWRAKLESSEAAWQEERSGLCAEHDQLAEKLAHHVKLEREREELVKKIAELEAEKQASQAEWRANLESSSKAWQEERRSLSAERDQLTEKLADRAKLELERDELVNKLAELEAGKQTAQSESRTTLKNSQSEWQVERSRLRAEYHELTRKLADHAGLELERDELIQKLAALGTQQETAQAEWRSQLLGFEGRLREQKESWNDQRAEWNSVRESIERERDAVQQKFDLALQDVQRHRSRVAELEQDLARRPEAKQADSAELVGLRAERDALAARIEQLEQRPASQMDANAEQQLSDLQRRFELAVEDVRELKKKNAALESKLLVSSKQPQAQTDSGGMDWESQKRRLLAALEGGDTNKEPIPKQDRVTIEGTIEMTDAVVAEKDRQIAELQAQLAAANNGAACVTDQNAKVNELLDSDEIIAEHRKRVQQLEREMQDKLRAAELEISVERAKIGRQKVELDELKADLDSKLQDLAATGSAPAQGQPKRRWRSKLGLSGDE